MKKAFKGDIVFKETQQFRQPLIWLLVLSPVLLTIGLAIFTNTDISTQKIDKTIALVIIIVLDMLILFFLYKTTFETIVTDWAVYYRWSPFTRKYRMIMMSDIDKVSIRKSPFLQIGYKRMVWGYGRMHNPGAKEGLQFILKSGRKIFIGSQSR